MQKKTLKSVAKISMETRVDGYAKRNQNYFKETHLLQGNWFIRGGFSSVTLR